MSTRNSQRRHKRKAQTRAKPTQMVEQMKELVQLNRQQLRYGAPDTVDVIFPTVRPKVYSTVVNAFAFTITSSTTAVTAGGYYTALSQLPQSASFINCFDRYRILMVNLQFTPQVSSPTGGGGLITAMDYDDASIPTMEIQQRDTAMVTPVASYFERTYVPRLALAAYGGTFTSYANMAPNIWVDCASSSVQYYGLKYVLPIQATAATVVSVSARIHIQFKNNF